MKSEGSTSEIILLLNIPHRCVVPDHRAPTTDSGTWAYCGNRGEGVMEIW